MADKEEDPNTKESALEELRKIVKEEDLPSRSRPTTRAAAKADLTARLTSQARSQSAGSSVGSSVRSTSSNRHTSAVSNTSGAAALISANTSSSEEESNMSSARYDYPSVAKFCGNVHGRADAQKWMAYDVYRWLKDSECRITSKKLTTDADKIRETILGVHPDIGDAAEVCASDLFSSETVYDAWKTLVTRYWLPVRSSDAYMAVAQLLGVEFDPHFGKMVVRVERAQKAITADIKTTKQVLITKGEDWPDDRKTEEVIAVQDILNYLGAGVLFSKLSPAAQEIFRDVEYKPTERLIELGVTFNQLAGKKLPRGIKEANVHFAHEGSQPSTSSQEEYGGRDEGEIYYTPQSPHLQGQRRGYRGRGGYGSRGQNRARGGGRHATDTRTNTRCRMCRKEGHWMAFCPDAICIKCNARGHLGYVCKKYKDDDKQTTKQSHEKGKKY